MIRGIIFDLDNTLYDYDLSLKNAEKHLFNYINTTFSIKYDTAIKLLDSAKAKIKANLKNTASSHNRFLYMQNICETIKVNPIKYSQKMYDVYWGAFFEEMKLKDFVIPLFNKIKQNDIKIAILSDLTASIQFKKIKKLGIEDFIDFIVTSEEVGADKPDGKMYENILNKMQLKSNEVFMVGDDIDKDYNGAIAVGIDAVILKNNNDINIVLNKTGI